MDIIYGILDWILFSKSIIMVELFLGHLAGDYLLQNEWMALNKSKNTRIGWLAAFIHCVLYTIAICLFMWNFDWYWILIVFLSHFPIDKFSLAEKYMHYIMGKGMKDYVNNDNWMNNSVYVKPIKKELNRYDMLEGGFTAIVYTITDNSIHLILMWGAYNLIY
jgi:hypothetical protein